MVTSKKKQRLYVDMDGTLAVFTPVDELETLYQKGYFLNQSPHENVVAAIKEIIKNHPEIDVHILSAYLTDSEYALNEKNEWLDKYLPEIDLSHRVFIPCGVDKKSGIEGGVRSDDFLLDDYTHNLNDWHPPAKGIKLLNAINHTRGSWEHDRIRYDRTPKDLANGILSVMKDGKEIYDDKILAEMERSSEMAKDKKASELASRLDTFMYDYDTYNYADEVGVGEEERESARKKIEKDIVNGDVQNYLTELNTILSENENAEENIILNSLINDLKTVQENRTVFQQAEFPIDDIAILDYVKNPDRNGTGGLDRASKMFHVAVVHTVEADYNSLYTRYDNAWTAANLNNDFQPKIAVLQLGEGDKNNHNRRFSSMEILRNVLHEQPSVENYELVYVRNEENKTENPMAQSRLCNNLYAEFNADTLRPKNYYGHSLSVGDVIVIANDFSDYNSYFVDDMGFTRLPENFLNHEMIAKIRNDFDISKELAAYQNIRAFEAEKGVTITDEASVNRAFELSSEYTRIFEMADRRGVIIDMNSLGYEPARYDGFSENTLLFKGIENEDDTISFDDWEKLKDFVSEVNTLLQTYSIDELVDMGNTYWDGEDTVKSEWSEFIGKSIQTALNNSGFRIKDFEIKDMVYMANYTYNGKPYQSAVWKQGDNYYISTGSKIAGNLTRHDLTFDEVERYQDFVNSNTEDKSLIGKNSEHLKVKGHTGTWSVIGADTLNGKELFLLESEQYGDEAASLIVDKFCNLILDEVYNGFDDYKEQVLEISQEQALEEIEEQRIDLSPPIEYRNKEHHITLYQQYVLPNEKPFVDENNHKYEIFQGIINSGDIHLMLRTENNKILFSGKLDKDYTDFKIDLANVVLSDYSYETLAYADDIVINPTERTNNMGKETEKPDLIAGDIMEFEGKQWKVKSNDGFMLSAENLDKNDNNSGLSWIGNVNSHNYTLIARAGQELEANKGSLNVKNMDLVANVQGIEFYSNKANPTLIIAYNENYHIESDEDVQKACERIFNNYYSEELTEHLQRQKEEWDRISTPIPNRYYEPALDLDGTADELYIQARNGYIENPEALHRIADILSIEGESDKAERVGYMEERENEDTSLYSVAQMKLDFMDGQYGGIDDVAIAEGLNLTVVSERDTVLISLTRFEQEEDEDVLSTGAASMSLDEFKKMNRADFERFVNEVNAYNMVEQERTPSFEKEQEINHGEDKKNIEVMFWNSANEALLIGTQSKFTFGSMKEAQAFVAGVELPSACQVSFSEDGDSNTYNIQVQDQYNTLDKVDYWELETETYTLGRDVEDSEIYYANVSSSDENWKGTYRYEFNGQPTRKDVEDSYLNDISMRELDRHEAEYGADGSRAFPNLNKDERITLHIRYTEARNFNGFNITQDSVVFDNRESMEAFVNGEATYDYLDNSVKKKDNEILQYAENADGEIVWGIYPIREFTRSDNGQIVEGSTIPALHLIEAGVEMGQANRTELYNAVQEFEQRNKVERPIINSEGNYEDKDLLYGGYDKYIARSHQQELSGYADRLTGEHSRESNLAELYYGLRNGLNEQQLDSMIEVANLKEYNNDMLRTMRYGYQSGQTLEQVETYSHIENFYVAEMVRDFMNDGATPEQLDAIRNLADQGTTYEIIHALRDGMDAAKAKIIVDKMAELQKWNTDQWNNNTPTEIHSFEYEYIVNDICNSNNINSLTSEMMSGYIEKLKTDRHYSPFDAYVEIFNHRDNENLHEAPPDIELSPKDKLKLQLESGVKSVLDSENFKNWLSTGGKLFYNNYSFNNAMLVWLQKPEATYIMGYEKWKDFGRNVAQGAQGAKIFIPLMASEKFKGGLYRSIKNNLNEQLSKDPTLAVASYRLGTSNLEFTMSRNNHLVGFKVNGQEQQLFSSDEEARRFIDRTIIGKVPTGFTIGTVFDAKDVIIPEYLWVKTGFSKEEIAPDEKGNPLKNRRGETRIVNTPERQARFQTELNTTIVAKDPVKMEHLLAACIAASERKGVPVSMAEKDADEHLKGGAKGYYSRQFTEDKPKGFIVLDNSLEITEKCAVLLHEMGHADLHNNLEALAKRMGEDKITKSMREVQAEATAYATASTFGIETDTSSFTYLAAYSKGFELQDFQKSLEVIFKETQALTADIKAELDLRGFNLDLTEKEKTPLDTETLKTLSTKYIDFTTEQGSKVMAALEELPSLVQKIAGNPELIENLKYQKENLDIRKEYIDNIMTDIERLNTVETREKQEDILTNLDACVLRITQESNVFENQTERFMTILEQSKGGLKVEFEKEPLKTLNLMKKEFPILSKLSDAQLKYVATSKFVSREYVKLLRSNPQEFVSKITDRADALSKVAAKNGTFVEINYCEQWTDKPFFEKGTLCSPKIADTIIAGSEAQARGFKDEAEKRGEYFPYTKCDITVFSPSKDGGLLSYNTRVDIGDGAQTSLKDHLEQSCKRGNDKKEILENFSSALTERANKNKIKLPSEIGNLKEITPVKAPVKEGNLSREEWGEKIKTTRENKEKEEHINQDEKDKSEKHTNREKE